MTRSGLDEQSMGSRPYEPAGEEVPDAWGMRPLRRILSRTVVVKPFNHGGRA